MRPEKPRISRSRPSLSPSLLFQRFLCHSHRLSIVSSLIHTFPPPHLSPWSCPRLSHSHVACCSYTWPPSLLFVFFWLELQLNYTRNVNKVSIALVLFVYTRFRALCNVQAHVFLCTRTGFVRVQLIWLWWLMNRDVDGFLAKNISLSVSQFLP